MADIEELEILDASEIHARRLNAMEVKEHKARRAEGEVVREDRDEM